MIHPIRATRAAIQRVRAAYERALGIAYLVGDVWIALRVRRLRKARTAELAGAERTAVFAAIRKGCPHTPTCPPASGPDRAKAAEVYADKAFTYLCNGLVLNIQPPDSLSGFDATMPAKEATR
ncbi:hypothetical protein [Streptomyces sp. NBC_01304]|uniref:hypothetical protein n=1 Tax=Streptomyces sp. NBC_01304 TaxID=2903818 RepID=UPI002E115369|nr:hypothetical protein OG430_49170 [Streptomyces sp. NBC_01304]